MEKKLKKDFVATALIFDSEKKVLLVDHKRVGLWLPPGGHVEEEENPEEALVREVKEETGFDVEVIGSSLKETEIAGVKALIVPFHMQIEQIPKDSRKSFPHEHIDIIYLCKITGGELLHNKEEHHAIKWFSLEEMKKTPRVSKDTIVLAEKALKDL